MVGVFVCNLNKLEVRVLELLQDVRQVSHLGVQVVLIVELSVNNVPVVQPEAPA